MVHQDYPVDFWSSVTRKSIIDYCGRMLKKQVSEIKEFKKEYKESSDINRKSALQKNLSELSKSTRILCLCLAFAKGTPYRKVEQIQVCNSMYPNLFKSSKSIIGGWVNLEAKIVFQINVSIMFVEYNSGQYFLVSKYVQDWLRGLVCS